MRTMRALAALWLAAFCLAAQAQAAKRFRRMERFVVDRLPVDQLTVGTGALNPVKVDTHFQPVFGLAAVYFAVRCQR